MRVLVLASALVLGTISSNAFGQCSCGTPVRNVAQAVVVVPNVAVNVVGNTIQASRNVVVNTVQTSRNVTRRVLRAPVRVVRAVRFCR